MAQLDPQKDQAPEETESVSIGGKKHKKRTVFYIVAVIIALLLFAAAVMDPVIAFLKGFLAILSPLIIGCIIAYLCDPFLEFYEYRIFRRLKKGGLRRGLSLLLTVITAFGIVALVGVMIIPQLIDSLSNLFNNYEYYLDGLLAWLQNLVGRLPGDIDISSTDKLLAFLTDAFGSAENAMAQLIEEVQNLVAEGNFLENAGKLLIGLFNSFKNLLLGIFIAFYILASKEKRIAQIKKFRRAMFSEKTDRRVEEIVTLTDKTFGGFIYGKILDSLVIGILTFVLLTIFNISEYNLLIATFVGVTNIIPVFGPFIGAIPSFFIVLISSPSNAFLFLILILIIQQLDGNIIGPKILGDNTGVSSLCVIIAIAICSALWGVMGMIIGVPIFAVAIELIKRILEQRLEAKGEPTDTLEYYPSNAISNAEQDIYYEHSHLRYSYEHSKLKPKIDRMRNRILGGKTKQTTQQATPEEAPAEEASSDTPTDSPTDTQS